MSYCFACPLTLDTLIVLCPLCLMALYSCSSRSPSSIILHGFDNGHCLLQYSWSLAVSMCLRCLINLLILFTVAWLSTARWIGPSATVAKIAAAISALVELPRVPVMWPCSCNPLSFCLCVAMLFSSLFGGVARSGHHTP